MNTTLLFQNEGKTLEFKRDFSSPLNIMKTLVAFSNTAGGRLVIGVEDDKTLIGVDNPLDTEERIASSIADSIAPRLVPSIEMMTIEGKTVIVIEVYLSGSRPHCIKSIGMQSGVLVRLGSSNRQADQALIAELQRGVSGIAFDEMPMPELSVDDLDIMAAQALFGQSRVLDEKSLLTLKLLTHEQGHLVPTKGGMLLFAKEREFHFSDAWVQCGRFIGTDKADIFDHIELHDHLPQMVDSIMLFLKKHAMRGADFSEIRRKDVWSIPLGILREVVINALVHSDYSQRGAPIRVAFFDDRIEVESLGILLPGMTIEDMKQGVSKIRNHVIARVFRELDLIEQWGSGIRRIIKQAQEQGLPELRIEELGLRVRVTVPLKTSLLISHNNSPSNQKAQSEAQSEAQSDTILFALEDKPLSAKELTAVLTLKTKTGAFKRAIKLLIEQGLIEYMIPDKPTSRLQRYIITESGLQYLDQLRTK